MGKEVNRFPGLRIPKELRDSAQDLLDNNKDFKKLGVTNVSQLATYLLRREIDRYCMKS